jgi:hypothetical protein
MIATPPQAVAHADWSMHPGKRWVVAARRAPGGGWVADGPCPVGETGSLLDRMGLGEAAGASVLLGFDFPIGLPLAYAELAGIRSFPEALASFGSGGWSRFFDVAAEPAEISLHRPFYPRSCPVRGQRSVQELVGALGMGSPAQLLRRCDRATADRRAACALFWTLGGSQVGKGALSGWREVLQPALRDRAPPALWPFDGPLAELLGRGGVVVAESYPAELYGHLGLRFGRAQGGGKRSPAARRRNACRLVEVCRELRVRLSDRLDGAIRSGFGDRPSGEDRFDATAGLLGMLNVVHGRRAPGEPADPRVRAVEGWILGQATAAGPA